MESKAVGSVTQTEVKGNQVNQVAAEEKRTKTEDRSEKKEIEPQKNYDAVSKYGDTLELSENGKKMAEHPGTEEVSGSEKKVISDTGKDTGKKISENILAGYSEAKLKQLYRNGEISKQQYERIMKRKRTK